MKHIGSIFLSAGLLLLVAAAQASGQDVMNKVGDAAKAVADKTVSETKKATKSTRRVGTTIGNKTWNGSKWVASKSWKGGKWVAVKGKNGTKWVYRKGRNVVTDTKRNIP